MRYSTSLISVSSVILNLEAAFDGISVQNTLPLINVSNEINIISYVPYMPL